MNDEPVRIDVPGLPEGWRLREVEPGDRAALAGLYALRVRALTEHPDAFGAAPESYPDEAAWIARHAERTAEGMVTAAVFARHEPSDGAEAEIEPVAMAQLNPGPTAKEAHKAQITAMYVTPGARGLGLGVALIGALANRARARGIERLGIAVTSHNPARRLYERAGFEPWGTEPEALKVGDVYYDEVWMTLRLV